ncbi:MAG: ATP-binding protein, partial [Bacilli bacterium]|nr:ATP-binding protein [Bacilli bacterium]
MENNDNKLLYDLYEDSREEQIIKGYLESDISFYMHGPTGVGKSARIIEYDPDVRPIYMRNASPERINGKTVYVPPIENMITTEYDGMQDFKPTWLTRIEELCNRDKDRLHVVFFDELSNAFPSIQGFIFNIMLSKEVNGLWRLPTNARVVAAGNETSDSLAANEISKPLFSRLAHIYLKDDYKSWINWASKKGLHPLVITFMAKTKGEFIRTEYTGMSPNADPRKWEMVSKVLQYYVYLQVLYTLIDKKVVDEFIKYDLSPFVPLKAIIDNDLWNQCLVASKKFKVDEKFAFIANAADCPEEYIADCYKVVRSFGSDFVNLFSKIWVRGDNSRYEILENAFNTEIKKLVKQ